MKENQERLSEHVTRMGWLGEYNACKLLMGKPEGYKPLERLRGYVRVSRKSSLRKHGIFPPPPGLQLTRDAPWRQAFHATKPKEQSPDGRELYQETFVALTKVNEKIKKT